MCKDNIMKMCRGKIVLALLALFREKSVSVLNEVERPNAEKFHRGNFCTYVRAARWSIGTYIGCHVFHSIVGIALSWNSR